MAECDIAILIITAHFLARNFPNQHEIPALLSRGGGCTIFPVLFSPCAWEHDPRLEELQIWRSGLLVYDDDSGAAAKHRLVELVRDVSKVAKDLRPRSNLETPTPVPVPATERIPLAQSVKTATTNSTPQTAPPPVSPASVLLFPVVLTIGIVVALLWNDDSDDQLPAECAELDTVFERIDQIGPGWREQFRLDGKMNDFVDLLSASSTSCKLKCTSVDAIQKVVSGGASARSMCTNRASTTTAPERSKHD